MMARGLGRSLLRGRKKKVSTEKLMGPRSQEGGGVAKEKGGALAVRPSMGLVPTAQDLSPVSKTTGDSDVVIIKKQVIQVRDILKDTRSAKEKERVGKKKALQEEKRKTKEENIEKPKAQPKEAKAGLKMPKIPGLGLGNYLQWLAFGVILNKLMALMPLLKKILNVLRPIAKFIVTVMEKAVGFIVGSIDLAYKGVDALKTAIKAIGGEGALEIFNKFGKLFTTVVNGALIAALVAGRSGMFKRKPGGKPGGKPRGPKSKLRKSFDKKWKKSGPGKAIRNQKAKQLRTRRKLDRAKKNFKRNLSKQFKKSGPGKFLRNQKARGAKLSRAFKRVKPGKFISKQAGKLTKGAPKLGGVLGKHASKLGKGLKGALPNLKGMAKVFKGVAKGIKIPIIGPLIVAGISIISGEGIGRAAFKGIGAALGGILGNLIPIPVVGMMIGEGIGMFMGDFLYEGFLGKGWGAAASKLKDTLKGMVTGAGKVGKAVVNWLFGGGLLSLLKNVGGGLARFAKYLFSGGLLMDIIKGAANVGKMFVDFMFGGGLFKLIGGIAGLPLKFAKWMLMTALPWTFTKIGGAMVALKDWLGKGVTNLIENFPTVPIPDINPGEILSNIVGKIPLYNKILDLKIPGVAGWLLKPLPIPKAWKEVLQKGFSIKEMLNGLPGVQEFLGFFAQHIPILKNWVEGGKLTKLPNLLFLTPMGMPFLMPTIAKSFFPDGISIGGGSPGGSSAAGGGGGGSSAGGDDQAYLEFLGIEGSDASKTKADGLDTKPSYGSDGTRVIQNTTTYIQPIEV